MFGAGNPEPDAVKILAVNFNQTFTSDLFLLGFMKIEMVVKSFFAHTCPFIAATLAFVGDPEVFNMLNLRVASKAFPLNFIRPPLFALHAFRLEQALA